MKHWNVVRTTPHKEDGTARVLNIASAGSVETYLPQMRGRSTRGPAAGRAQPLFPGYVFARFDAQSGDLAVVKRTPGVAYLLGYDGVPVALPEDLVWAIEQRLQQGVSPTEFRFSRGDQILFTEGPLGDLEDVFDRRLSGCGRSLVLVQIVGRYTALEIHESKLVRAT